MTRSIFNGAAVLLALTPAAMAGMATVVNNCGRPIYYAVVSQGQHGTMQELAGGSFSQSLDTGDGNGHSIKIAPSPDSKVTQFEYTPGVSMYYDISNIDGNPFAQEGMSLVPDKQNDPAHPTCVPIVCPPGSEYCDAAYNLPDDERTHVCDVSTNLVFTVCTGGPSSPSSSAGNTTPSGTTEETGAASSSSASASAPSSSSESAAEPSSTVVDPASEYSKPPTKREEHAHRRVHSRAFRV